MSQERVASEKIHEAIEEAIKLYGASKSELIPILSQVNRQLGYLPVPALAEISEKLNVPPSDVLGVASFYSMLSTRPRGRHVVQFCESAPCHVVGGREVWEALQETLQLKAGETSPDEKWTLETTSCVGLCSVGPVVIIDEDVYSNVDVKTVPEILNHYS